MGLNDRKQKGKQEKKLRELTGGRRLWANAALALAVAVCLNGCGSSKGRSSSDTAAAASESNGYSSGDIYEQEGSLEEAGAGAVDDAGAGNTGVSVAANRKLIRTVRMGVETEEFDGLLDRLEQRVAALGGYMENLDVYNGSQRNGQKVRSASMTIRIPKGNLNGFVSEVSEVSNVVSKSESTEDVTLNYVDLESRKKSLQVEQERLLELLGQAVSMEDIITIEERLSQVRYELESMESQLRTYDNLVDFSTVYLSVNEVERLTPVEEISDLERMGQGFAHSVENLFHGLKEFFIGLVVSLPYLVFMAALVVLAAVFARAVIRRGRKKREERLRRAYQDNASWQSAGGYVVERPKTGQEAFAGQTEFGRPKAQPDRKEETSADGTGDGQAETQPGRELSTNQSSMGQPGQASGQAAERDGVFSRTERKR